MSVPTDASYAVLVEHIEDEVGKGGWVAKGEELLVDLGKNLSRGTKAGRGAKRAAKDEGI